MAARKWNHWARMTHSEYRANLKRIGVVYREVMGWYYPAITAMEVVSLMEDRAKVEIQAMAVIPE